MKIVGKQSEERTVSFTIADFNSRCGMFLAVHFVYACWIGLEMQNGARKGSVVAEIFDKHCGLVHCSLQERRDPLENANCDSRCWIFSALACFYECWIGLEKRNGARKGLVVAEIFEKHCGLVHCEEREVTLKLVVPDSRRGMLMALECVYGR
jgi:hypothetical protein